jgi:hypothetical protein
LDNSLYKYQIYNIISDLIKRLWWESDDNV